MTTQEEDFPVISDVPELITQRRKAFVKKYEYLDTIPVDKGFPLDGIRNKWAYVISEFNKESGKIIKIKQTKEGLFAQRVS